MPAPITKVVEEDEESKEFIEFIFRPFADQARWVGWKPVPRRGGTITKVPYRVHGRRGRASVTNPAHWTTLEQALAGVKRRGLDGVGVVLGEGLTGVDLDGCRNPETGEVSPWALEVVERFMSYTELSPSGTGLKIYLAQGPTKLPASTLPQDGPAIGDKGPAIEAFVSERYFAVTGTHLPATPEEIREAPKAWRWLMEKLEKHRGARVAGGAEEAGEVELVGPGVELTAECLKELEGLDLWTNGKEGGGDRSRNDAALAAALGARGWADADIEAALWSYPLGQVGAGKLQGHDAERQLERLLERCAHPARRGNSREGVIERYNRDYAVVWIEGKVHILRERPETPKGFHLSSVSAFNQWTAPEKVVLSDKGRLTSKPAAKIWFHSPRRRQYDGIGFWPPGTEPPSHAFNVFRGWGVEPGEGGPAAFPTLVEHVREVVCGGDEAAERWVWDWVAQLFQDPSTKPGTSLVLKGLPGTGKTLLGKIIGLLVGRAHYLLVSSQRYVTGDFNAHMEGLLLLQADESFWAGDKKAEGMLKDLITGDSMMIERKGVEAYASDNYVRLLVTSNERWVVPVGLKDRRFTILELAPERKGDHAYFERMMRELEDAGGLKALLGWLLEREVNFTALRQPFKTGARVVETLESLTPEQRWLHAILERGVLPRPDGPNPHGAHVTSSDFLSEDFMEKARRGGSHRRAAQTHLGLFLKRVLGDQIKSRQASDRGDRYYVREFPPLEKCREMFASYLDEPLEWESDVGDGWSTEGF